MKCCIVLRLRVHNCSVCCGEFPWGHEAGISRWCPSGLRLKATCLNCLIRYVGTLAVKNSVIRVYLKVHVYQGSLPFTWNIHHQNVNVWASSDMLHVLHTLIFSCRKCIIRFPILLPHLSQGKIWYNYSNHDQDCKRWHGLLAFFHLSPEFPTSLCVESVAGGSPVRRAVMNHGVSLPQAYIQASVASETLAA